MASLPLPSYTAGTAWPSLITDSAPQAAVVPARLSQLEWSVVAMAERDSVASLRKTNGFWSVVSAFFGIDRPNPLASERLEALRRVAVFAWRHRWNVPKSELRSFIAQGFSMDQYELLQVSISKSFAASRKRRQK